MQIKEFVAECRKRSGKKPDKEPTHQQFAELIGVSRPTVWAWENGNQTPSVANLELMAKLAGTTLDDCLWLPPLNSGVEDKAEAAIRLLRAGLKLDATRDVVLDLAELVEKHMKRVRQKPQRKRI